MNQHLMAQLAESLLHSLKVRGSEAMCIGFRSSNEPDIEKINACVIVAQGECARLLFEIVKVYQTDSGATMQLFEP